MLKSADDVESDQVVYLFPHTKTASRACHRMLVVRVKEAKRHWPMVVVTWEEAGQLHWELVHKDNIRTKPVTPARHVDKKEGDMARNEDATASRWARVRKMPGKAKPIDLAPNEEQGTLF